jgi:hypothetical protein
MLITVIELSLFIGWTATLNKNYNYAFAQTATSQIQASSSPKLSNLEFLPVQKAGDASHLTVNQNFVNPDDNCEICQSIQYTPGLIGKAGVAYKSSGELNLGGAQRIVFFAKGQLGGENVAFVVLGKPSNASPTTNIFSNLHFAVMSKNITLTNDWARYQIGLNGSNLAGVTAPFGFIVSKVRSQAPATLSNNANPQLTDANASQIGFFLKGVTFDNNPAINPISTTNSLNSTITPSITAANNNHLNSTAANNNHLNSTAAIPNKAATTTNHTFKWIGPVPYSTSSSGHIKNMITSFTQGNGSLASSPKQPLIPAKSSSIRGEASINSTYSKAVPITSNQIIPQMLAASNSTLSERAANVGSNPIKMSTGQNVISSNSSVPQNQQLPHVLLVPSQQTQQQLQQLQKQQQIQPSLSASNSGQSSNIMKNPAWIQSQNQQQSPRSLIQSQQLNQSPLTNTYLQHQYPYQSQAPYPYQSQAPYPYQSQAPYPYQSQAPIANQAPPIANQAPPIANQAPPIANQAPPIANQAPPMANAGISQEVTGGSTVTLDGRASYDPDGRTIAAYQWIQLPTSTGSIPVTLEGANTATPKFTAPILQSDTVLAFSLRVTDSGGAINNNPSVVYVVIKHPSPPNIIANNINNVPNTSGGASHAQQQLQQQTLHELTQGRLG